MSKSANTLPRDLVRKLARECLRCGQPAAPDSDECAEHEADTRKRKRKSAAKRRARLRKAKRCRDCGKRSKKLRCPRCEKKNRRVDKITIRVDKPADGERWRVDPGTNWNRFRGKGRRGRLTREEQIAEDVRDARFAIAEIEKFIEALGVLQHPEVQDLPPIQRAAAKRVPAQFLGVAGRFLDEIAGRYGDGST